MREVTKGMGAAGNIVERYLIRVLGPIGKKIAEASKAGRVMALLGVVTVIVSLALIFTDATWFKVSKSRGRQFVNITYEQKGYGVAFLAGLGLFGIGVLQKKGK
ncbi:MAG: hypothetical protein A2X58_02145 [Nitrospirae bacterium GWC2_56_14]|nr:MAG: hypothetical protein A2X58_02145 [Nitrospirae bacterium GWC2_56_14]